MQYLQVIYKYLQEFSREQALPCKERRTQIHINFFQLFLEQNTSTSHQITKPSLLPASSKRKLQNSAKNLPAQQTLQLSLVLTHLKEIIYPCMDHVAPINWTAWRKKGNQGAAYELSWFICMWDLLGFQLLLSSGMSRRAWRQRYFITFFDHLYFQLTACFEQCSRSVILDALI